MATARYYNEDTKLWEELNAQKLETPRKINGVEFDGSQDITLPTQEAAPEVFIGKLQPSTPNFTIWIKHELKDDLYYLRQIRDANPTSQLPALWRDDEDPYTQWEGVNWDMAQKAYQLSVANRGVVDISAVGKLKSIQIVNCINNQIATLDLQSLALLYYAYCYNNQLTHITLPVTQTFVLFFCQNNRLTSIPSLTSKGNIVDYDFRYNNFPTTELDRFRGMGFTDESKLLPQNP